MLLTHAPRTHELDACGVSSIRGFEATSFRQRPLQVWAPHPFIRTNPHQKATPFFWYIEKEPQRPYDQNGGSIAPRSPIFDPIAKEPVYQKHTHTLGVATTAVAAAEEFPVPARRYPITQRYHIPFGSSPLTPMKL